MAATGRAAAVALDGLGGRVVEIEAALTNRTPGVQLVGLPDTALREAQVRVRSAIEHSGFAMPKRHLTVNLSPAALPKHGSGFDLGIAMAVLATDGVVPPEALGDTVFVGELALDGRLRPVAGVLPAVRAARDAGRRRVVVPTAVRAEAELVTGIDVVAAPSLLDLAIRYGAEADPVDVDPVAGPAVARPRADDLDLADVLGNDAAVEALVVAAAGGHHLLMVGPPGAGKTMLATRLPGLLPDLDDEAALDVACVASLAGEGTLHALPRRPPWQAPHHTASSAAIVGGGTGGRIRPGALTRASGGVLFLDEAAEFSAAALEALREPLESGVVHVDRAAGNAVFPARVQLVMAANPCPCGLFGVQDEDCTCPSVKRQRYDARLSGPLKDRIDIRMRVERVTPAQLRVVDGLPRQTTATARARVSEARVRAGVRLAGTPWRTNAEVPGPRLRSDPWTLAPDVRQPLDGALAKKLLTMRGHDRVVRLAWTLADLAGIERPGRREVGLALNLRTES